MTPTADIASIDFETRSVVDLRRSGVYPYAESPQTEIICMAWRIGEGDVSVWRPGDADPQPLLDHICADGMVAAHNAGFERALWNAKTPRHWPRLIIRQQDCTMSRAVVLALPGSLDQLCKALKTKIQKDDVGHRLMLQMCKPRSVGEDGVPVWWEAPEKIERLAAYCVTDVETERLVGAKLPALSASERRVWELDQTINDRGVGIDVPSVEKALSIVTEARKRADERMWWLTDGDVKKCSETAKIVSWLNGRGIPAESVAKGEIEEIVLQSRIFGDDTAEEVVRLRRAAGRTSTDKYRAMLNSVCADGRVRGTLAYHGAGTGRWAGRIIQPQNFPRIDADKELSTILTIVELLALPKTAKEIVDCIEMVAGPTMEWMSKCLRAMLIAGPGKKFVSGDFSNIEGRVNAWISGEHWKLDAFRAYDAGTGPDLYKLAYAKSFGIAVEDVDKGMRQVGKTMELALGFQGGAGAFITMGANMGVHVSEERANELKVAWREAHPFITQSWWDLQDAAIAAVGAPGMKVPCLNGKVQYLAANGFLFCQLPSGRVLAYADPKLVWTETLHGSKRLQIEYWGVDSYTKRWGPQRLYGGVQSNNVVQGAARDLMVEAMFRAEDAGYPIVLTVHDELLSEVAENFGSAGEYQRIMSELPQWAKGLPVATAAWEDKRYVK
jgi:DNA polymerase